MSSLGNFRKFRKAVTKRVFNSSDHFNSPRSKTMPYIQKLDLSLSVFLILFGLNLKEGNSCVLWRHLLQTDIHKPNQSTLLSSNKRSASMKLLCRQWRLTVALFTLMCFAALKPSISLAPKVVRRVLYSNKALMSSLGCGEWATFQQFAPFLCRF